MAKQTKRQRKFLASGGVKRRIERGTITKHGKMRKRGKSRSDDDPEQKKPSQESQKEKRDRSDDFVGQENLGELDIDSFFSKLSEKVEEIKDDDDGKDAKVSDGDVSSTDDDSESGKEKGSGSESDEDSDDDDIEAAEARMKSELSKLKESDPEFHDFLRENEKNLLEFGNNEEDDNADKDEIKEEQQDEKNEAEADDSELLTPNLLTKLAKGAFEAHGIKPLRKLISAYKSACHLSDSSSENEGKSRGKHYHIESSKVFDELMMMCLNKCHEEFHYHLLGDDDKSVAVGGEEGESTKESEFNKPINPKSLEKAAHWSQMKRLMMSFFQQTLHLLEQAKDPDLLSFVLKSLSKSLRYLSPFPRIAELMLKTFANLWSAPIDSSEDYQVVRLNAFFRIRQLALTQPFPFIEGVLKKTYLAYAKRAKFATASGVSSSLPTLTFMGNCLVELYSLDYHSSYQHAFVYIRQLALLLRSAIQKKTKEAVQQVYCWQFVHCLKLWVAVLSAAAAEEDGAHLRSLIYPLTEIILGTVRFAPSPVRHMPCRFHCIRLLQQLAAASETFIPTTSVLLECLDWKEWYMHPKKVTSRSARATRGLHLAYILKLPGKSDFLRTHEQLEAGINDFFLLLNREIELYRYSAGFPEFAVRIHACMRRLAKRAQNPRWRTYAKTCIELLEKYSRFAVQARSKLAEAPKDVKRLECLKPLQEKNMRERHEESVAKEQKILDATRPAPVSKKSKANEDDDSDSDSENSDSDEKPRKKAKKAKKKQVEKKKIDKKEIEKQMLPDDEVMEEADQVEEGIDWSDEESN